MYNKSFDKTKYISPILMGGFGNNLFQIATTIKHSEDNGYPMVFGYWTSYNSKLCLPDSHPSNDAGKPNPYFQPWGGWPGTGWDDFTWRNMFPDLPFLTIKIIQLMVFIIRLKREMNGLIKWTQVKAVNMYP